VIVKRVSDDAVLFSGAWVVGDLRALSRSEHAEDETAQGDTPATKEDAVEQPEHISQFFAYAHLPEKLQAVSKPFGDLAESIVQTIPRNPERTVALRKLLEAKDAAVRAFLAK
jgi:hypothetical protein